MPEINCKICGSAKVEAFEIGGHRLIKCADCTAIFSEKIPGEEELRKYYESEYKIFPEEPLVREQRRIARIPEQFSLIREISDFIPAPSRILDIGCDKGFFLDECRRMGYQAAGVEPSENARKYAENIGLNIYKSLSDADGEFDVCTMWHSLEHHPDPVASLGEIRSRLRDGGMVFVRVPNFHQVWQKLFRQRWIWFQPENHYYHFGIKSLGTALKKAGFRVERIESRRSNTRLTRRMDWASRLMFGELFGARRSLRKRVGRAYENVTGVEVFAAARK